TGAEIPRLPSHAVEKASRRHPQRTRQLDHRVDPRESYPPLQLTDLGAVQRGTKADLFLREFGSVAGTNKVRPEHLGNLDTCRHHQAASLPPTCSNRSRRASCSETTRSYSFAASIVCARSRKMVRTSSSGAITNSSSATRSRP